MKRAADTEPQDLLTAAAPPAATLDAAQCVRELEAILPRAEANARVPYTSVSSVLALVATSTDLCLVCTSSGLELAPRLLRAVPLAPLYKKWRKRKGKKDTACYVFVHNSRTGITTGGPPEDSANRRVITFPFAGFTITAWFSASAAPDQRNYTFLFEDVDSSTRTGGWTDPQTGLVLRGDAYISPKTGLNLYTWQLLNRLRDIEQWTRERDSIQTTLERYPIFVNDEGNEG